MAAPDASRDRITRDDLEDKFRELEGERPRPGRVGPVDAW